MLRLYKLVTLSTSLQLALLLYACAPLSPGTAAPSLPGTPAPLRATSPSPTYEPFLRAPATQTPVAAEQAPAPRLVVIPAPGGAELQGTLYGDGKTGLVLAHTSDSHQDSWADFALVAAESGYLFLTFDFRFWENGKINDSLRDKAAEDVLAAADFLRVQGAEQIVLAGASLGGMATAKAALQSDPAAVIILSSPLDWPDWPSIRVSEADIAAIQAPILLINSERDDYVEDTRRMYKVAGEPKEIEIYPGGAHATDLFRTAHAADLAERMLAFLQAYTPAAQP